VLGDTKKATVAELKAVIWYMTTFFSHFFTVIESSGILRFIKYFISGGIGTIIDFSLFSAFILFTHYSEILANIISFSLGTIVVCYLQKNWTFKYKSKSEMMLYVRYFTVILVLFSFNTSVLFLLIRIVLIEPISSKAIQVFLSVILGYFLQKYFVFRENKNISKMP